MDGSGDHSYFPVTILGLAAQGPCSSQTSPKSCRTSYIGGQPIWHDPATAPSLQQLACRSCGSCSEVVLLAHVYCPIREKFLDRSLYIFACNKRKCSLTHNGWTVVRNQKYYADPAAAAAESGKEEVKKETAKKESAWDFLATDSSSVSCGVSGTVGDDMDDLEALLERRDRVLQNTTQAKVAAPAAKPSSSSSGLESSSSGLESFCRRAFPLRMVEDVLEPSRWWADGEEEGGEGGLSESSLSEGRIAAMLAEYMRCEEDSQIVEALSAHQSVREQGGGGNSSGGRGKGRQRAPSDADSLAGDDDRLNDFSLTEFEFQRTVSLEPRQVLRYCYNGSPLWCAHPPPPQRPPPCPCGAERVYEFQLMPGLLSAIPELSQECEEGGDGYERSLADAFSSALLDQSALAGGAGGAGGAVQPSRHQLDILMQKLGAGLDFGVVTVWCCPLSCDGDCPLETALVQPPSDILH